MRAIAHFLVLVNSARLNSRLVHTPHAVLLTTLRQTFLKTISTHPSREQHITHARLAPRDAAAPHQRREVRRSLDIITTTANTSRTRGRGAAATGGSALRLLLLLLL